MSLMSPRSPMSLSRSLGQQQQQQQQQQQRQRQGHGKRSNIEASNRPQTQLNPFVFQDQKSADSNCGNNQFQDERPE